MKRILCYLAGTTNYGLLLKCQSSSSIIGFSDANWGANVDDRKSTTAYCIYISSNLVSWSNHKQKSVSRSSTEAEYDVVAALLTEVIWTQSLLSELRIPFLTPKLYYDNLGVVLLSANPVMHPKTKHFELDLHFVHDHICKDNITLLHLPARFQVADPLTKSVSENLFLNVRDKLMVVPNPTMSLTGVLTRELYPLSNFCI